jgi:hypothetical protein
MQPNSINKSHGNSKGKRGSMLPPPFELILGYAIAVTGKDPALHGE